MLLPLGDCAGIVAPAGSNRSEREGRSDEGEVLVHLGAGHLVMVVQELLPLRCCVVVGVGTVGRHPQPLT